MPASPKFCIFGAGAIGGMIATLLARSGATVSVIARGQTLAALNRDGVRLIINSEDPSELGVQDYVIIAVKAPQCLQDVDVAGRRTRQARRNRRTADSYPRHWPTRRGADAIHRQCPGSRPLAGK